MHWYDVGALSSLIDLSEFKKNVDYVLFTGERLFAFKVAYDIVKRNEDLFKEPSPLPIIRYPAAPNGKPLFATIGKILTLEEFYWEKGD